MEENWKSLGNIVVYNPQRNDFHEKSRIIEMSYSRVIDWLIDWLQM